MPALFEICFCGRARGRPDDESWPGSSWGKAVGQNRPAWAQDWPAPSPGAATVFGHVSALKTLLIHQLTDPLVKTHCSVVLTVKVAHVTNQLVWPRTMSSYFSVQQNHLASLLESDSIVEIGPENKHFPPIPRYCCFVFDLTAILWKPLYMSVVLSPTSQREKCC